MTLRAYPVALVLLGLGFSLISWTGLSLAARVDPPAKVDAGRFVGTWIREQPRWQQVVMLRRAQAKAPWEIRFQWEVTDEVTIDTNWKSHSEYQYRGFPGTVDLTFVRGRSNETQLWFHYRREQKGPHASSLVEEGDLTLYRSASGRHMVWLQEPLKITSTIGEPQTPEESTPVMKEEQRLWIFQKAAERMLFPDELPW